ALHGEIDIREHVVGVPFSRDGQAPALGVAFAHIRRELKKLIGDEIQFAHCRNSPGHCGSAEYTGAEGFGGMRYLAALPGAAYTSGSSIRGVDSTWGRPQSQRKCAFCPRTCATKSRPARSWNARPPS